MLIQNLLTIWEESVRATHLFLSDAQIQQIKESVPQALGSVSHLIVAERERDVPIAFMGVDWKCFFSPHQSGAGGWEESF